MAIVIGDKQFSLDPAVELYITTMRTEMDKITQQVHVMLSPEESKVVADMRKHNVGVDFKLAAVEVKAAAVDTAADVKAAEVKVATWFKDAVHAISKDEAAAKKFIEKLLGMAPAPEHIVAAVTAAPTAPAPAPEEQKA